MIKSQIKRLISNTITMIGLYSKDREDLIYKTGIVESRYASFYEWGTGPARSFWQVNPSTAYDNFINYLNFPKASSLKKKILVACCIKEDDIASIEAIEHLLTINIAFAISMCAVWYKRDPEPLPLASNLEAQGVYWDFHYNHPEKGLTASDFVKVVKEFES